MFAARLTTALLIWVHVFASCVPNRPIFDLTLAMSNPPPQGSRADLTMEITNLLDTPLRVTAEVELPGGIQLVDGELTWDGVLAAGETETISVGVLYETEGKYVIRGRVIGGYDLEATTNSSDVEAGTALQIEVSARGVKVGSPLDFLAGTDEP